MVIEAHGGGLSSTFRKVFAWVAERAAAAKGTEAEAESLRMAQRISVTLHRENARAVLRRLLPAPEPIPTSAWVGLGPTEGPEP